MHRSEKNYTWLGWATVLIFVVIISPIFSGKDYTGTTNTKNSTTTDAPSNYTQPASSTITNTSDTSSFTPPSTWSCIDATSYNKNGGDDNKCIRGSEVRYVSDSQATELDLSYSPGKSGAAYYNNQ